MNLKAAMEITAEKADYAENAEAERIRFEAMPSLAFSQQVRRSLFPMFHESACSSASSAFSASSVATPIAVLRMNRCHDLVNCPNRDWHQQTIQSLWKDGL
jgi:hypothetical protein